MKFDDFNLEEKYRQYFSIINIVFPIKPILFQVKLINNEAFIAFGED